MSKKEYLEIILRSEFDSLDAFYNREKMDLIIEIAKDNNLSAEKIKEMKNDSLNIY